MDLGACEVRTGTVQYSRPQLQSNTSQHSITPVNAHHDDPSSSSITSTPSDPTTAIRWSTPQSRLLTPPVTPKTTEPEHVQTLAANETVYTPSMPPIVRFDEEQVRSLEAQASERPKVNDVDLDSGPPTPSNDDTPYIRFAIDQLTREEDIRTLERQPSGSSADSYPVARVISDHGLGYIKPQNNEDFRKELAAARRDRDALQGEQEEGGLFKFNATRPLTSHSNPTLTDLNLALKPSFDSEIFIPVPPPQKTPRYPDLAFVPTIIRPLAMIVLSLLCVLMIAAIIFCAVHSSQNDGLALYTAGIYGGRYFVFGFLPQIFAACIFIYVQAVMAAITRIMPYTLMAMDEATNRTGALFLGIHPRSLLWPRWDGYLTINICNLGFWLSVFTIPLQSCLFTVLPTAGGWKWTAVQGVSWTLVTIYIIILGATITTCVFFFGRTTGLMWDPRSLADIILMLPRSNILRDFPGTETMESKQEIKNRLAFRSDRLGYWRTPKRTQAMFYCIGEEGASTRQYTLSAGKLHEKPFGEIYRSVDLENVADLYSPHTRFRHLPWFLRDTFVILWSVAAFIILLALIIVSFLPSSAIRKGFPPHVPVVPTDAGFSAANFLYSFIPSILGMILYLLFQPLDMAFRKLQPWAELSQPDGVNAEQSLLLDYPAAFPVSCTISAIGAGHYRVAVLSLLSFFFALLPVLSGGLFFALTTPSGTVRMIPNLPAFYILLVLLIFYFLGLLLLIPGRHRMHLPHDVDSLSEIISFVHGSRLLDDAPFRAPRSKADLVTRLMAVQREGGVARFAFGVYKGRHGKECLGIDRIGRIGAQEVMVLSGR